MDLKPASIVAAAIAIAALPSIPAAGAAPVVAAQIGKPDAVQLVQYYDSYRRPYYAQRYPAPRYDRRYDNNYDYYWRGRAEADARERPITRQLNMNEARRAEEMARQPYYDPYYDPYYRGYR